MVEDPVARAWALKAECYAAWHSEPQRTREAADAVAALAAHARQAPVLEALAGWTDGIALMAEGRLADALARLGAAESAFEAIGDEQHAAEVQVPQMGALSWLGREDEVVALGRRALERFVARGDERSAAKVEINLGTSLSRQDRPVEAERVYRSAVARGERLGDPYLAAMAGIGLANALTWQFRSTAALRAAARARRLARAAGQAILEAQTLEATGQIELNRGGWAAALAALARALRLLESSGAAPQRLLECETTLADAYAAVQLHDEAIALYRRIVDTAVALPAPNEEAYARLQLGRELARCGQAEAALASCTAAREIYRRLGNAAALAQTDLNLARARLDSGDARAARESAATVSQTLQQAGLRGLALESRVLEAAALARLGEGDAARQAYAAALLEAGDLGSVAGACRAGLAALALAAGDLERARDHAWQALQRLDAQRLALPTDELRAALGQDALALNEILVATSRARVDARRLLADVDRGRSRALATGLAPAARPAGARVLSGRLMQLRQSWREAMADDDGARLPVIDAGLRQVESALLETQRRELLSAGGGRARLDAAEVDHAAIGDWQRALGPTRALVVFHLQGAELLTIVVTDEDVRLAVQPGEGLAERIAGLRLQVEAARNPALAARHGALLATRLREHAGALHAQVWAPAAALAGGREDFVVVPHGPLHDLPWAMLHDGGHWLVEHCRLTLAPSAAVWADLQARPASRPGGWVVAAAAGGTGLAHVDREVAAVAAAHGPQTVLLQGAQASAAAIRRAASGAPRVLHLACHARFRADNPAFSTLHLADGPLPMHELARWRLDAALVVLSACETGVSRVAPGEEAFGLVRAVMLAGARSVVASHWAVADRETADLLHDFHARLRDGAPPGVALQRAQAAAAAAGRHPYHWAAFAVHGAG